MPAISAVKGGWDHAEAYHNAAENVTPQNFAARMDAQYKELEGLVEGISHQDFSQRATNLPWGEECKLGDALMRMAYATLVAYRMQLFLQCKAAGTADIGPANCWVGVDMPAQPAAE